MQKHQFSLIKYFYLFYSAPSAPPQSVTVTSVSSTTMELSWQLPPLDQQNGLIQSYTVIVFEVDTNTTQQIHQDFIQNSIVLTGLRPYYTYMVSVAAYTVGLGPATTITATTEQDGMLKHKCIQLYMVLKK